MNSSQQERQKSEMKLLPHQTEFIERVFSPATGRIIVLKAFTGLGKSTALVGLVDRLLQEQPNARALLIAPKPLTAQFAYRLSEAGVPTLVVDRYVFREMLDSAQKGEIWPLGKVVVLSIDFARQPDVLDSLMLCHWDIVLVDEWHLPRGMRTQALQRITTSAEKVVLASATPLDLERLSTISGGEATFVEWRPDLLVDFEGKPLIVGPRPVMREIPFSWSEAELRIRAAASDLIKMVSTDADPHSFRSTTILRSLDSSPAALERALQRLIQGSTQSDHEELAESVEWPASNDVFDRIGTKEVTASAEHVLEVIDTSTTDSKLSAFSALLMDIYQPKSATQRIVVLTDYIATLFYLAADIEGRGIPYQLLHGGMSIDERVGSLKLFSHSGRTLVATRAVIRAGLDFRDATDLVLYDVPESITALKQILAQFDRIGRVSQLNVYILTATNAGDRPPADVLTRIV